MELILLFFLFILSFSITFFLVPLVLKIAYKLRILDSPDGKLKKHDRKIPYLGGLAIYLGFILSILIIKFYYFYNINNFYLFFLGLTFLLILGLIDDILVISPLQKIIGQSIISIIFLKICIDLGFVNYFFLLISFIWFLTIMNAFNFVDVMDGLATTISIFAGISFLLFSLLSKQADVTILLVALLGTLFAFLYYNKPNATIYLGDAGSLFLGGFFSIIPFFIESFVNIEINYLIPIIILTIPLLEITSLIVIRTYKKIPFYLGSPDHFSIYLQQKGWNKNNILLYISLVSIILGIISLLFIFKIINITSLIILSISGLILWYLVLIN